MKANRRGTRPPNHPLERNVAPITAYRLFADSTRCEPLWPLRPLDRQPGDSPQVPQKRQCWGPSCLQKPSTRLYTAPLMYWWTISTSVFAIPKLYQLVTAQILDVGCSAAEGPPQRTVSCWFGKNISDFHRILRFKTHEITSSSVGGPTAPNLYPVMVTASRRR